MAVSARSAVVDVSVVSSLDELLGGRPVDEVFSQRERRLLAGERRLFRWAGRLAAKLAVLELLGEVSLDGVPPLHQIEIVPERAGRCFDPGRCARGHRPIVELPAGAGDGRLDVSISHERDVAVALAIRTPGDGSGGAVRGRQI
jgi:phosphopantetheinyl transferase (holo-ACP synthase)